MFAILEFLFSLHIGIKLRTDLSVENFIKNNMFVKLIIDIIPAISSNIRHYISSTTIQKMETKPVLFGDEASPPVRFVLMTASFLGIQLEYKTIDLFKSENNTASYKKVNFLQKVPALAVSNEVICDSHSIALYFCNKNNNHELYPKDFLLRAKVDQMLFFNSSTLFPIDSAIFTDFFVGKPMDDNNVMRWYSSLDYLEYRLNNHAWLAGEQMFLCDLCCGATVSSLLLLLPTLDRHAKVNEWLGRLQKLPCFEINSKGLERLKSLVEKVQ